MHVGFVLRGAARVLRKLRKSVARRIKRCLFSELWRDRKAYARIAGENHNPSWLVT